MNQKHLDRQKEMINDMKVLLQFVEEDIDPTKKFFTKMNRSIKVGNSIKDMRIVLTRLMKSIRLTSCVECGNIMDAHDDLPPPHNKIRECPNCGHPNDPGIRE